MGNYSFKTTGLPEPVNGVIEGHNFTQGRPHTAIYGDQIGLTFRKCNLLNCEVPDGSVVDDCLTCHVSFCSHLNDGWLEMGVIDECAIDCEHLVQIDTITIDGESLGENRIYENKVVT